MVGLSPTLWHGYGGPHRPSETHKFLAGSCSLGCALTWCARSVSLCHRVPVFWFYSCVQAASLCSNMDPLLVPLCVGCGRAVGGLASLLDGHHVRRRQVCPFLKRTGPPRPWAGHLETYEWANKEYCELCCAWCMVDTTVGKHYTHWWRYNWPMTIGYLLGTNVARTMWRLLPPSLREQWRGLYFPGVEKACATWDAPDDSWR